MATRIAVDVIDEVKEMVHGLATAYARGLPDLNYADVRIEISEGKGAAAENGNPKFSSEDYGFALGVRVLAGRGLIAPGYHGLMLGRSDLPALERLIKESLDHAHRRALANAAQKEAVRQRFGELGEALTSTRLAPIPVHQDVVLAEYEIDPREVALDDIVRYTRDVSRAVAGTDQEVRFNLVYAITGLTRELFCSSEGALIDQTFALTQGMAYVVAAGERGNQELYDYIGHQRGWEVAANGIDDGYLRNPSLMDFSMALARDTLELSRAEPLVAPEGEVVVVTDPHYNTLLVHEIVGHPTELDRALKMETAYAGRTWLMKDLEYNMMGKRIGSPLLNAYSDPALPGYGHYKYDHEGTPGQRVVHIENGIFRGFMNSRQTAAILNVEPNGSYKATDASLVPLIRMSNTVFGAGQTDPQQIIGEVDRGYYLVGNRTPSIAESRENFRISAMKVYEIHNGQLGKLYRDGGMMADSQDYFMNVDAVGSDFRLYPIPNCGKGQPMQTKKLGNGGPTLRSRARLTGA